MNTHLKKQNVNNKQVTVSQTSFYQGQLPSPQMMQDYNSVDSSFANRIITMAENEAAHMHKIEKSQNFYNGISLILGMIFALTCVMVVCYLVYFALSKGYDTAAATIATGVIVGIAAVFIYRKNNVSV